VGESDGKVTIYRGLNADLPGISLSTPYETTDVEVDLLPGYAANDVAEGIEVSSLDDAHNTVEKLAERQTSTDTAGG
jgi:protein phosphatase